MSLLNLSHFADFYWKSLCGGLLLRKGLRFTLNVTASWSLRPGVVPKPFAIAGI